MAKGSRGGKYGSNYGKQSFSKTLGRKGTPKTIEEALENVNKVNFDQSIEKRKFVYSMVTEKLRSGEMTTKEAKEALDEYNDGYTVNCQRCVWAYELQRRGYDVEALPNLESDNDPNALSRGGNWMKLAKNGENPVRLTEFAYIKQESNKDASNNALKVMQSWGEGSRGVIRLGRKSGSGHVFNVEYSKGKIIAVDAQSGKKYTSLWKALTENKAVPWTVQLVRTDNVEIDMNQVNKYVKKRGA